MRSAWRGHARVALAFLALRPALGSRPRTSVVQLETGPELNLHVEVGQRGQMLASAQAKKVKDVSVDSGKVGEEVGGQSETIARTERQGAEGAAATADEGGIEHHQQARSHRTSPMAVFILAPLTMPVVELIKVQIRERDPSHVKIFTQSDTFRCGQEADLGGQLASQKAGCEVLLGDKSENPGGYKNIFGDQFNQAWLGEEWAEFVRMIRDLKITAEVFLYPTQLSKNPDMDAVLDRLGDPNDFKDIDKPSQQFEEWKRKGPLEKYWHLWCLGKTGKREPVYDLGTVVDFVLWQDPAKRPQSLAAEAQKVDWCVAKQPNAEGDLARLKMVYFDVHNANYTGYCKSDAAEVEAAVFDKVKVASPTGREHYARWLTDAFEPALKDAFAFQPVGKGAAAPQPKLKVDMDALIYQDTIDADNAISVVWLLKAVNFRSARVIVASQPANFRLHKLLMLPDASGKNKPFSWMEDYRERVRAPSLKVKQEQPKEQDWARVNFNPAEVSQVFKEYASGRVDVAWPQLYSDSLRTEQGDPLAISQINLDKDDSELMQQSNAWRWHQWMERFGLHARAEIIISGVARATPMSNAIIPYTFYFFDDQAATESSDFVVDYPTYQNLEKDHAERSEIWRNLHFVWNHIQIEAVEPDEERVVERVAHGAI